MKFTQLFSLMVVAGIGAANIATAQVNGTRTEAQYGLPWVTQIQGTQFGDANSGDPVDVGGSELAAVYGYSDGIHAYIFVAGNLEDNYNKLNIWMDNQAGGQNRVLAPFSNIDFNNFQHYADSGSGDGLTFDTGFEPDTMLSVAGGGTDNGPRHFHNVWTMPTNPVSFTGSLGYYLGSTAWAGSVLSAESGIPSAWNTLESAVNNSNTAGVPGYDGSTFATPAACAAVTTGVELKLPIAGFGEVCDAKFMFSVNAGGHDFFSNQFLPALGNASIPIGNVGYPRNLNLETQIPGVQFKSAFPSTSGTLTYNASWTGPNTLQYTYTIGSTEINGVGVVGANGEVKVCGPMNGGAATLKIKPKFCLGNTYSIDTTNGPVTIALGTFIQGNLDGDDEIGPGDLQIALDLFGTNDPAGDADNDGEVGPGDLQIVLDNFGL